MNHTPRALRLHIENKTQLQPTKPLTI